jgi:hypothetical protein
MTLIKTEFITKNYLSKPRVSGIYELSERQFNTLKDTANSEHVVFSIINTLETDSEEMKEEAISLTKEIEDLIKMGLVKNVSDQFTESINMSKLKNGREFNVYSLTPDSVLMFLNRIELSN